MSHKEPSWMCTKCKDTGIRTRVIYGIFADHIVQDFCPKCHGNPASLHPKTAPSPPPPPRKA